MNCTNEELESMKLIMQKRDIALFNCNPTNLNMDATEEQLSMWIKNALEYRGEIEYLFQNWWDEASRKYKLEGEYQLDFNRGEFIKIG